MAAEDDTDDDTGTDDTGSGDSGGADDGGDTGVDGGHRDDTSGDASDDDDTGDDDEPDELEAYKADVAAVVAGFAKAGVPMPADKDMDALLEDVTYRRDGTPVFDASSYAPEKPPSGKPARKGPARRRAPKGSGKAGTVDPLSLEEDDFDKLLAKHAGIDDQ